MGSRLAHSRFALSSVANFGMMQADLEDFHAAIETFARAKMDALLKDAGWKVTDGRSVRFEYALDGGSRADYILADRDRGISRRCLTICFIGFALSDTPLGSS
jgi:hypothetical protein